MKLVAALSVLLVCVGFIRGQYDVGIGVIHRLNVIQDVSLEAGRQHHTLPFLITGYGSLLQFENLDRNACPRGKIVWAKMYVFYVYAHKSRWQSNQRTPWRPRPIEVYEVNKPWNESLATATISTTGERWDQLYLSTSGNNPDAGPGAVDTVTVYISRPRGFIEFDVTSPVRNWDFCSENNGVLIRSGNTQIYGRHMRFSSNADPDSSRHAYINVFCQY